MEKEYSVQFFQSLVENLQDLCRNYLNFNKFVEVSGYISVEIDNAKKERYVLSEMLHNNGHTLSESYCTKAFKTCYSWNSKNSSVFDRVKDQRDDGNVRSLSICQNRKISSGQTTFHGKDHWPKEQRFPADSSSLTDASMDVEIQSEYSTSRVSFSQVRAAKRRRDWSPLSANSSNVPEYSEKALPHSHVESLPQRQDPDNKQDRKGHSMALHEDFLPKRFTSTSSHISITENFHGHRQRNQQDGQISLNFDGSRVSRPNSRPPSTPTASKVFSEVESGNPKCNEIKVTLPPSLDLPPEEVKVKPDPEASIFIDEDNDTIDLDLYDDDMDESHNDFSSFMEDQISQEFLSANPGMVCPYKNTNSQTNPYIEKTTRYAVKKLNKFCYARTGQHLEVFSLPPVELDSILTDFFNGLRKKDGNPYDPRSLRTMQCNIDKHLKNGGYSWSILKDSQFIGSRQMLKSLLGDKVTNKPQFRYNPLTSQDIETLFTSEQLGLSSAESLLNTMWLLNIYFFGIKSLTEHFHLKWGDLVLLEDGDGLEYLQHVLKGGQIGGPKVHAKPHNQSRCFVHLYKQYAAKRPPTTLEQSSPFYLNVSRNFEFDGWYMNEPLSWYKLASLWKKMMAAAGLPPDKKPMFNLQSASTGFH